MRSVFEYVIVRVVPHVEREEFVNAGVVVYCRAKDALFARIELDEARLRALGPVDLELVRTHLAAIEPVCRGDREAGPVARLSLAERFSWLVSPRSTMIQTSPPHSGVADDLEAAAERIIAKVVRALPAPRAPDEAG